MSHLHFPDGILPIWLWVLGYVVTFLLLYLFLHTLEMKKNFSRLSLLGLFSAVMFLGMSFEFVPIAYHINLSVIAGIILGPALGFLAVFIVNTFSAFLGHGGITVIGLNTLTVGFEAIVGFYLFKTIHTFIKRVSVSAFITTFITLFLSTLFTVGIVYLGTQNLGILVSHGGRGFLSMELGQPIENSAPTTPGVDFARFLAITLPLGFIGWILESFISSALLSYLAKEKADILPIRKRST
jgi:cobalt/nickel transport system permease protein